MNLLNIKKKLILLSLIGELTSLSLTGCAGVSNVVEFGGEKIVYFSKDSLPEGSISYENIDKYIKIITIENNNLITKKLLVKYLNVGTFYTELIYFDLKTGVIIKRYNWKDILETEEERSKVIPEIVIGKDVELIEEQSLTPYLISLDNVKMEYTTVELIDFYETQVQPLLEEQILKKEIIN